MTVESLPEQHREYVVTAHSHSDLDSIYAELENSGCGLHGHFPDRAVDCLLRRPTSRNTHYLLTEAEADRIRQDPRVWAVELSPREQGLVPVLDWTETSANFGRNSVTSAAQRNWGLLRCWNGSNPPGYGSSGPGFVDTLSGSVTVYASGTNVDVVMVDGLSDSAHPEFAVNPDGTGGSRSIDYDWFAMHNTALGIITPSPNYQYVYTGSSGFTADNNHGCHTAGTVAGNTQGWARNANIYRIDPIDRDNINFGLLDAPTLVYDYIREFHKTKPINPSTGLRNPTICNNSWGYSYPSGYISVQSILSINYRGTLATTATNSGYFNEADCVQRRLAVPGGTYIRLPIRMAMVDADVQDAIADGVVFVASAGNSYFYADVPGGPDYNNTFATPGLGVTYYNRGASPGAAPGAICVGSIQTPNDDRKSSFSNTGPRVDVFAPGSYIMSSFNNGLSYGSVTDPRNASYRLGKLSGTSMSGPQVTGILACLLEKHPTWTQTNILSVLANWTAAGQVGTGGGVSDPYSLLYVGDTPNRYLRVPAELLSPPGATLTATVVQGSLSFNQNIAITPVSPVSASGGTSPYTFAVSPALPVGLAMSSLGVVSGTPLVAYSTSNFQITVTDSLSAQATATISVYVAAAPVSLNASTVIPSVSLTAYSAAGSITPVTASGGSLPYTFAVAPSLPTGLIYSTAGVLSGTPTVISATATYTVTVTDSAAATDTATFNLGVNAVALSLNVNYSEVTVYPFTPMLPVTPISAVGGNGTKTYAIAPSLPAGLNFNTGSGEITGTPTQISPIVTYTVTVTDQIGQTDSATFTLDIQAVAISSALTIPSFVTRPNTPITPFKPITVSGGSGIITYSISPALPSGLTLNASTGFISGTPTITMQSQVYTMTATDQVGQTTSQEFSIKVRSALDIINADNQNTVYDLLFRTMGTTATGYGAYMFTDPVSVGQLVKDEEWDRMLDDFRRVKVHQYGTDTNNLLVVDTGDLVLDGVEDRDYTWAQLHFVNEWASTSTQMIDPFKSVSIYANDPYVSVGQLSTMSINTNVLSPSEWHSTTATWFTSPGNGHIASSSYTWFYPRQLNYFFNLGGRLKPEITLTGGLLIDKLRWVNLINQAKNVVFGKKEFYQALANGNVYKKTFVGYGGVNISNAVRVTYTIVGSQIQATVQYVAGYGKFKKNKKKYKYPKYKKKSGKDIILKVQIATDFTVTYANGSNGGIAAPIPQTQLINNAISINGNPVAPFDFAAGESSDVRTITVRNNSTQTANVSSMYLTGYTTGTLSTSSMVIAAHTNKSFTLQYTGNTTGYYRGFVNLESNINNFSIFTEISVGSIVPARLEQDVLNYDPVIQKFMVEAMGGEYRKFTVSLSNGSTQGFSIIEKTDNSFTVKFNPVGQNLNALFSLNAVITIYPKDNSVEPSTIFVPIKLRTKIKNYNLGRWRSALGHQSSALGLSYDWKYGRRFLTVGIGTGSPVVSELSNTSSFPSWGEVYRIEVKDEIGRLYSADNAIKSYTNYADSFGVGVAKGSVISVINKNYGNIEIKLHALRDLGSTVDEKKILLGLANAFYYYDPTVYRSTQLETANQLTNGGMTRYFDTFTKSGGVVTALVKPNS